MRHGPGIDVEPMLELAGLGGAAELGKAVAAAQRPVAAAGAVVELQHLHLIAGLAQLQRRRHAGQSGAQDKDRCALRIAFEPDRTLVARFRCEAEARHRVIHRRAARHRPDQGEQVAPPQHCFLILHIDGITSRAKVEWIEPARRRPVKKQRVRASNQHALLIGGVSLFTAPACRRASPVRAFPRSRSFPAFPAQSS